MPRVPVVTPDAKQIRARRLQLGLSQRELSLKLGRNPRCITHIEDGQHKRVSDDLITQIAYALGAEVDELIKSRSAA
jgi:transcriptional regulator with XRE-family HTH domain